MKLKERCKRYLYNTQDTVLNSKEEKLWKNKGQQVSSLKNLKIL